MPKTGLTSLTYLMRSIGCRNDGGDRRMRRWYFVAHDYESVLARYDTDVFFSDGPTCLMYKEIFHKYGRAARFILTERKTSAVWLESLKRHNLYAGVNNKTRWIFGRFYPHGFDDEFKSYYERHNRDVVQFFDDNGAADLLLVLRCEEPGALARISEFLGVEFPVDEFPRMNVSSATRPGATNFLKRNYNRVVQAVYGAVAPRLPFRLREAALPLDLRSERPTTGVALRTSATPAEWTLPSQACGDEDRCVRGPATASERRGHL
jgi:hypothetical protein